MFSIEKDVPDVSRVGVYRGGLWVILCVTLVWSSPPCMPLYFYTTSDDRVMAGHIHVSIRGPPFNLRGGGGERQILQPSNRGLIDLVGWDLLAGFRQIQWIKFHSTEIAIQCYKMLSSPTGCLIYPRAPRAQWELRQAKGRWNMSKDAH